MKATLSTGSSWHDLWIVFFAVVIVVGFVIGHAMVIAFGVMGLLAGLISVAWNRLALEELSYQHHLPQHRVFVGEEIPIMVSLTNKKPVPLAWVRVEDEISDALQVVEGDIDLNVRPNVQTIRHSTAIAWYERIRWDYRIRCTRRGLYHIGPTHIESGDPFGFLRSQMTQPHRDSLMVYPRVFPLEELGLPAARPFGEVRAGMRIFQDPSRPSGLRDYQHGDPLKIVDWKATARSQRLLVRTFEPSASFTVILVVAVDTRAPYWGVYPPEELERVVTAAASLATYAAERQYTLGLFSNDMPVSTKSIMTVPPSRGRDLLSMMLGALATIRSFATAPMASLLAQHSRQFPMGATLAVITAFFPQELADTLDDLSHSGYKVVVIYVGEEPCPQMSEEILIYELRDYFVRLEESDALLAG